MPARKSSVPLELLVPPNLTWALVTPKPPPFVAITVPPLMPTPPVKVLD